MLGNFRGHFYLLIYLLKRIIISQYLCSCQKQTTLQSSLSGLWRSATAPNDWIFVFPLVVCRGRRAVFRTCGFRTAWKCPWIHFFFRSTVHVRRGCWYGSFRLNWTRWRKSFLKSCTLIPHSPPECVHMCQNGELRGCWGQKCWGFCIFSCIKVRVLYC